MSFPQRFSSSGAILLASAVSLFNYGLIVVTLGIFYDMHLMRTAPPDRPVGGGPATMMAGLFLAPLISLILAPVTFLVLRRLSRRQHHGVVGAAVLGHLTLFLLFALFLILG